MQSPKIPYADYHDETDSLPTVQLNPEDVKSGGSTTSDDLCWVADVDASATAASDAADEGPSGNNGKRSAAVRMEVLGPRRAGSDKMPDKGSRSNAVAGSGSIGAAARVCLMYAGGATYRVFSLPAAEDMFGRGI